MRTSNCDGSALLHQEETLL